MIIKLPKVLVIATSRKTRGGITSVVKAHETGVQWKKYHCMWIETHQDKSFVIKFIYFLQAFTKFVFIVHQYKLVHIHTSEPPSALRKIPFLFIAKLFKKKVIVHFHAFSPDTTINSRFRFLYQYLFEKADMVIVLSEYWKTELNQTFCLSNKIEVLYNPCSKPDYSKKYNQQKNILYAGTISARKGYSDLIKAFSSIAINYPEWNIIFAGNGEVEQGKQLAEDLKIDNQIIFLGWVNGEEKSKAFQQASIFCLPSYAEGFPMAVLDAWAYGLPVVTTSVGGLSDVLRNKKNALVFEPGNIHQLACSMQLLIEDEQLRNQVSDASKQLAETTFSPKIVCKQLDGLYSRLIV
ncbi:MAG: glycosyltransferase family 4 protein [Bacteroidetes bacterium]|nr:glycosyltransferase family 4 protein [Bacteroidota bacterium]